MTFDEWLASQPVASHGVLQAVHDRVVAAAPDRVASVAGGMLVFGPFRYRYASGREGDSALVAVAVRAGGISVYVNSVRADGTYVAEAHRAALGKVKVGKSCIVVKKLADLHLDAFEAVIREAVSLGGASALR